jgi:CRP-like cAMP-binding protein
MDIFEQLDIHKTGAVAKTDWCRMMSDIGIEQVLAEEIFIYIDRTQNQSIDRVDWLHMLESVRDGSCPETVMTFSDALAAIHARKGRIEINVKKSCCIMRPDSTIRMTWDMTIMSLLFYIALVLPYSLGFAQSSNTLADIDRVIDVFFMFDVVLNFRTAYLENEVLVTNGFRIATHYLKTWFLLDVLTCIPFEDATAGFFPDLRPAKLMKVGKVLKVCKLLRLTKVRNKMIETDAMADLADKVEDKVMSSEYQTFARVGMLVIQLGLACHWLACFMTIPGKGWQQNNGDKLDYYSALYWAMSTLTTVGYGDIIPVSTEERCYAIVSMVIGGAFYGYIVAKLSSTIAAQDRNAAAYSDRMDEVRSWLYYHTDLPKTLRKRIKKYFRKHLTQKAAVEDCTIINDLSPALVHDVSVFLIPEQVRCNVLFHTLPNSALVELLPLLQFRESEAHDHIVAYGDPGVAMYVITDGYAFLDRERPRTFNRSYRMDTIVHTKTNSSSRGTEAWLDGAAPPAQCPPGKVKVLLTNGDSFGEEIVLGIEEEHLYSVVARTAMQMFCIHEEGFQVAYERMPDVRSKILDSWNRYVEKERQEYEDDNRYVEHDRGQEYEVYTSSQSFSALTASTPAAEDSSVLLNGSTASSSVPQERVVIL